MSEIFIDIDGELLHSNVYNKTVVSILKDFENDGDETVITVTVTKRSDKNDWWKKNKHSSKGFNKS